MSIMVLLKTSNCVTLNMKTKWRIAMNKKGKSIVIFLMLITYLFATACGNNKNIKTDADDTKGTSMSEEVQSSSDKSSDITNTNVLKDTSKSEKVQSSSDKSTGIKSTDDLDNYILPYPISVTGDKKLTLKLHGKKLSKEFEQYGICNIEVFDGEKLIQNIKIKDAIVTEQGQDDYNGYTQSFGKDGGLTTIDLNFDGFKDIGLIGWLTTGANTPCYYWLWNEEKQCFDYAFCMSNIEVDSENKQLISKTRDGAIRNNIDYYKYDDNSKLQNVKRIVETVQEDGTVKSETYKIINGALQKVN